MKKTLQCERLKDYIQYIWVFDSQEVLTNYDTPLISYTGVTPEMILPISGYLRYQYKGVNCKTTKAKLFAHIHSNVVTDLKNLSKFVLITFKSKAIAALLPFISLPSTNLIKQSIVDADQVFGASINSLQKSLKNKSNKQIVDDVEDWLWRLFDSNKEGFIADVANHLGGNISLKPIMNLTNYSYSTIERKFKKEIGLSPKNYLLLKRFKAIISYMVESQQTNWMDYVVRFGFYDQSHFIKEIKKFTGFTPSQILFQQNLLSKRPDISFLTNFYNEPS